MNTLQRELSDGVLTIRIARPDAANAVNARVSRELAEVTREAELDPAVRVVVLCGAGDHFCSGGDVRGFGVVDEGDPVAVRGQEHPLWNEMENRAARYRLAGEGPRRLYRMPKPTLAAIRGACVGAGVGLAASCDLRIASETAVFQSGYVRIGLSPDWGASWFVTRLLGPARAREFFFTNRKIPAAEARELGLVGEVVPDDRLEDEVQRRARTLADGPPIALAAIKDLLRAAETEPLETVLEREALSLARAFLSADAREAVAAFRERRTPSFGGR